MEPLGLRATYSLCVLYVHVPTHSTNGKALASIVWPHWFVKFGGNIGEIWKLQGKMSYSEGGPSNG